MRRPVEVGTELLLAGDALPEFDELPECVALRYYDSALCAVVAHNVPLTHASLCATRLDAGADGSTLLRQERYDWSHIPNLDAFFTRLYVYFLDKGFFCTLVPNLCCA